MKYIYILATILFSISTFAQGPEDNIYIETSGDIETYTQITTTIPISVHFYSSEYAVKHYEWDMYGDGSVLKTTSHNYISFNYTKTGIFTTIVTAHLQNGEKETTNFDVLIKAGNGTQKFVGELIKTTTLKTSETTPLSSSTPLYVEGPRYKRGDGITDKHAIIINGCIPKGYYNKESDDPIYDSVKRDCEKWYKALRNHGYIDENIYYHEIDKSRAFDENLVDNTSSVTAFKQSYYTILDKIDEDDILFLYIADHGYGYKSPEFFTIKNSDLAKNKKFIGAGDLSQPLIENGTEISETDTKVKVIQVNHPYSLPSSRFPGLNKWVLVYSGGTGNTDDESAVLYRVKFIADADDDKFIEMVADYLKIDTNKDGLISKQQFIQLLHSKYDLNANNEKTYTILDKECMTANFDESEWRGEQHIIEDNVKSANYWIKIKNNDGSISQKFYLLFDIDNDDKLDISYVNDISMALDPTTFALIRHGSDTNNDGYIDRVDFNTDGDYNDKWDVDENISLAKERLYSSDLNKMLGYCPAKNIIIMPWSCFSGGFIKHISAPGRIVLSPTQDKFYAWSGDGPDYHKAMFDINNNGYLEGDYDKDGIVTILELYTHGYNCDSKKKSDLPQYNDNGDSKMYNYDEGMEGSGCLGSKISLNGVIDKSTKDFSNTTISTTQNVEVFQTTINSTTITSNGSINAHLQKDIPSRVKINSMVIKKGGNLTITLEECKKEN